MNRMLLGYNPDLDLFEDAAVGSVEPDASVLRGDCSEAATALLEAAGRAALPALLSRLLRRAAQAAGGTLDRAVEGELVRRLRQAARLALPVPGVQAHDGAAQASRFFGVELEGLSPEDQEFECARRFIRLVEAAARHAATAPRHLPAPTAARLAAAHAARRFAPGWLAAQQAPPGAVAARQRGPRLTAGGPRPTTSTGAHHA